MFLTSFFYISRLSTAFSDAKMRSGRLAIGWQADAARDFAFENRITIFNAGLTWERVNAVTASMTPSVTRDELFDSSIRASKMQVVNKSFALAQLLLVGFSLQNKRIQCA